MRRDRSRITPASRRSGSSCGASPADMSESSVSTPSRPTEIERGGEPLELGADHRFLAAADALALGAAVGERLRIAAEGVDGLGDAADLVASAATFQPRGEVAARQRTHGVDRAFQRAEAAPEIEVQRR